MSLFSVSGAAALLLGLLVAGTVGAGSHTTGSDAVDVDDPVGEGNLPPTLPTNLSSVATGGYWEEADRNGILRVIVVNRGQEQVHSLVFIEWLEERIGEPLRRIAHTPVSEINDDTRWSVDTPVMRPSKSELVIVLPAVELGSYEERRFELIVPVQGVGQFELR